MKRDINNSFPIALEYWDTKQKFFFRETNLRYVSVIVSKTYGDMQTFNAVIQKMKTRLNKHKMTNPGYF